MSNAQTVSMAAFMTILAEVVADQVDLTKVTAETRFVEDLGLDSMTLVALVFLCEEAFGIDLEGHGEKLAGLLTVGDSLHFFAEQKGVAAVAGFHR